MMSKAFTFQHMRPLHAAAGNSRFCSAVDFEMFNMCDMQQSVDYNKQPAFKVMYVFRYLT